MEVKDYINLIILLLTNLGFFSILQGRLGKLISKTDKKQDIQIKNLNDKIEKFGNYIDSKDFSIELNKTLENCVADIIEINGNLDNTLIAMILDGKEEAYIFFKTIKLSGLENINEKMVRYKAITIFKKLRKTHGENLNITNNTLNDIKTKVAYPYLQNLEHELKKINRGDYNGTTDKEFIAVAHDFVYKIVTKGIELIAHDEKYKLND